jgi:hypothetical protein
MSEYKNLDDFDNYYSLKSFFDFFHDDMKSKGALNVFPGLEELLRNYLTKLSQKSKEKDLGNYQFFRKIFNFPGSSYYIAEWNIQKTIAIAKNNIKKKDIPIDILLNFNSAHQEKLGKKSNLNLDEPIVVVYYPPNQEVIIIDGNHRFYKAVEMGLKSISAYILYPNSFLETMSNDLCQALYKIHNNINVMANVVAGNLKMNENPQKAGLDRFFEMDEI